MQMAKRYKRDDRPSALILQEIEELTAGLFDDIRVMQNMWHDEQERMQAYAAIALVRRRLSQLFGELERGCNDQLVRLDEMARDAQALLWEEQ
jgi:hypothetical protein